MVPTFLTWDAVFKGKGTGWGKQGEHYQGESSDEEVDEYGNKVPKHGSLKAGIKGALVGTIG